MAARRLSVVLLALVLLPAVAACDDDDGDDGGNDSSADIGADVGSRAEEGEPCPTGPDSEAQVEALPAAMLAGQSEGLEAIQEVLQFADEPNVVEYAEGLVERAAEGGFPSASARADRVEILSDRAAVFEYTLLVGEPPAEIPQGEGFAVCVDAEWKFSLDTFCNLTGLLPPGCPADVSDLAAQGLTQEQFDRLGAAE